MLYEKQVIGGVVVFEAGEPPAEGTRVRVVPIEGLPDPGPKPDAEDALAWVRAATAALSRVWPVEDFPDWGPPDGRQGPRRPAGGRTCPNPSAIDRP